LANNIQKTKMNPVRLGKLEALRFKMQLQFKNLKLLIDHNEMMQNIVKGDTMGKRENKLHTNQSIVRLERELEKSSK